jgi:type II secretory pathway pseudopilin PulG
MRIAMRNRKRHFRNAFTLIEATGAAVVLGAILVAAVPMILLVQSQRRENAVHRVAVRAADNLLERVLVLELANLESEQVGETIRADEVLDAVPGGAWSLKVIDANAGLPARRITITVSYRTRGRTGSVHLTAWSFGKPESNPDE